MCTELELIKLNNDNNVNKIESEGENKQKTRQRKAKREIPTELECIIDEYKDTFKGTGKLKNYQCRVLSKHFCLQPFLLKDSVSLLFA